MRLILHSGLGAIGYLGENASAQTGREDRLDIQTFPIEGLVALTPKTFGDHRGYFMESYNKRAFAEAGIDCEFIQDNQSSSLKGTLRGLHFQINVEQAKLLRVLHGEIYDVAVDIRPDSPTYGQWQSIMLSAENRRQFFVPRGFAHGFQVVSDTAVVLYKVDNFWSPENERGLLWSDPQLGIDWPDMDQPILSDKDKVHPLLNDLNTSLVP